jgi:N-ethylmaleimide reductase
MGAPEVGEDLKAAIHAAFGGTIIFCGGQTKASAELALQENRGHLAAFGRPFISNPDLVKRLDQQSSVARPRFRNLLYPRG